MWMAKAYLDVTAFDDFKKFFLFLQRVYALFAVGHAQNSQSRLDQIHPLSVNNKAVGRSKKPID